MPIPSLSPSRPGRRRLLTTAAAALAMPWLARPASAAFTWTAYSHLTDPASASVRGLRRLSDLVRDSTGGELLIRVRTAGTLPIDAANVLTGVASGQAEIGDDSYYATSIASAAVLRLPMLVTSPAEFETAVKTIRARMEAECAARGLLLLGVYRSPMQSFWSRVQARGFADIARQRLRVMSGEQAEFVRYFGGLHLMMSGVELTEALQAGKADGTFSSAILGGRQWKAFLKHAYLAGPNYNDAVLLTNREAFDLLPARVQDRLRPIAAEIAAWITGTHDTEEATALTALAAEGATITAARPAEVQEAVGKLAPFWDTWVRNRGRDAEAALTDIRQMLDR